MSNFSEMACDIETPAFILDEWMLSQSLGIIRRLEDDAGLKVLFPLKTFNVRTGLLLIAPKVSGFSTSSLFETQLADQILEKNQFIHFSSPGLKSGELTRISGLCDYLSLNSINQLTRVIGIVNPHCSIGIRVNTGLSIVKDCRYDPCRTHSKLGIALDSLIKFSNQAAPLWSKIQGVSFHTNCESDDYGQLLKTIRHLDRVIPKVLSQIKWLNIGGGYLLDDSIELGPLYTAVDLLKRRYDLDVFFEPGRGVIGETASIVSQVIDIFESGGKNVAVLDTTINHMPEVFEYQYKPKISNSSKNGKYKYILAGASCLAGDIFGEYSFKAPLSIGSKIIFEEMGAYTMVKANMFNGINLPSIYLLDSDHNLKLIKQFSYEDFLNRCGEANNETAREINNNTESISKQQSHRIFSR